MDALCTLISGHITQKLNLQSTKCVFLGYSICHKGYKCIDSNGKLYIVPALKFFETKFPFLTDPKFLNSISSSKNSAASQSKIESSFDVRRWEIPSQSSQSTFSSNSTTSPTLSPNAIPLVRCPNNYHNQHESSSACDTNSEPIQTPHIIHRNSFSPTNHHTNQQLSFQSSPVINIHN